MHLGSLDRYLAENGHCTKEFPEPVAAGWLKSRKAGPNYQNTILCCYRGFANYLAAHGIMAYTPDSPLDLKSGYIVLLETKNNRERIVPIRHGLTEMLLRYAAAMDILADPEAPVFPNRRPKAEGSQHRAEGTGKADDD